MIDQVSIAGELAERHLATFDTLDFEVFSNQEWSRFHESHGGNVLVHWPDGHTTTGLDNATYMSQMGIT